MRVHRLWSLPILDAGRLIALQNLSPRYASAGTVRQWYDIADNDPVAIRRFGA
jgi:hypothetical protein